MLVSVSLFANNCQKSEPSMDVKIFAISEITHNSVIISCNASAVTPGLSLYEKGACYSETPEPAATADSPVGGMNIPGNYNTSISGLKPDTKYYLRAFVKTDVGYMYSETLSFNTNPVEVFTDPRDGQAYNYIDYIDNSWMVENLDYKAEDSYYFNNDSVKYAAEYGRLYSYEAAAEACPDGWKLPSDEDWKLLEMELSMQLSEANLEGPRGSNQGSRLKEPGNRLWFGNENNKTATNHSGFTAKPSGAYSITDNEFSNQGLTGYHAVFWTEANEADISYIRVLHSHLETITRTPVNKSESVAYSVRCIKIK